jgi:hypothetical protein
VPAASHLDQRIADASTDRRRDLSDPSAIIECMFDTTMQLLRTAARAENSAAGHRLALIGELDLLWLRHFGERETWGTDTHDAITDEIAAALRITRGMAHSYLDYARAMRLRLPRVGALLVAGDIDYRTFQTVVYRTDLIAAPDVLAAVDATLAVKVTRWPGITQGRLGGYVDRIVARADLDAVRRRRELRGDREVSIWGDADGLTEIFGRLHTTDAHAIDARLDALAATVCADDPRTRNQRRADAMGALAIGADRLACRWTVRLSGPVDATTEPGGDSCDRRSDRGRRRRARIDDRQRCAHPRRAACRAREIGQAAPTDPPR